MGMLALHAVHAGTAFEAYQSGCVRKAAQKIQNANDLMGELKDLAAIIQTKKREVADTGKKIDLSAQQEKIARIQDGLAEFHHKLDPDVLAAHFATEDVGHVLNYINGQISQLGLDSNHTTTETTHRWSELRNVMEIIKKIIDRESDQIARILERIRRA